VAGEGVGDRGRGEGSWHGAASAAYS
jgi:hypothetical protein